MSELLVLESVTAGYGDAVILEQIDLRIEQGASLAVLGRNGVGKTTLLLLDEPLEGLAPIVALEVAQSVKQMMEQGDITAVVVEQHPVVALQMTSQAVVLERGRICHRAPSDALARDEERLEALLGVA